jgi:hypothetical protein
MLYPELTQGFSESTVHVIGHSSEIGLIAERLSANGASIGTGTEIAHELPIREPARSREVAAGNRADGIIVRPRRC